jgi:arabinogalactan oligomer/maltooligosaccharide transport system permease protein
VAAHLDAQATRAEAIPGGVSSGAALALASWDVDAFRRPHGLVTRGGVDPVRLGEATAATLASFRSAVWVVGLGVALVLLFFSSGLATRTAQVIKANATAYGYVLPAMLGMIVLVFFPFAYGIVLSFTGSSIYNMDKSIPEIWVGLENFKEVIGNVAVANKTDLATSFDAAAIGAEGCAEERNGEWVWADCSAPEALPLTVTGTRRGSLEAELVQDGAARAVTVNGPSPRHVIDYQNFYWTLWVTIAWTVLNVAIGVSVGLMLALILNTKGLRLRQVYRVVLILPWAVPNYITALIWKGMFHQQFGVVNQFLQMFGVEPVSWFEKPLTSFLACLATNGWLSFPFMMVISLGALQSIPSDLYEAARVDGATRFQQFRHITLPSLKPALVPAVILSVVWTFNMFNIIYLVSAGEPAHSTEILVTQAYKLAFEQYRYGYAAAYSTVIFLILLAYGTWQNRFTRATEGI